MATQQRKVPERDCQTRSAAGRSTRKQLSRSQLGEVGADAKRPDPIKLLLNATEGRLERLLPIKYARMAVSPFAFFRGSVSLMAADLASQPHTGLTVQLCGDAHLANLGWFETPDGRIVFDVNDFDETIAGPWEWDVKRMAASIVLAGWESDHGKAGCQDAAEAFAESYCACMEELAEAPILFAARYQVHRLVSSQPVGLAFRQAKRATPVELLRKYTEKNGRGEWAFREIPKALWRVHGEERKMLLDGVAGYVQSLAADRLHFFDFFRVRDAAFKIVGTGSVGLRAYVVLMEGNGPEDPLFLQVKQEVPSAYSGYLKPAATTHQGQRVAEGQRRIQPISDLLLGWTSFGGHDFLVRQLNDHKGTIDFKNLKGTGLRDLGIVAGRLLARGHARSGDALAIRSYLGAPDKAVQSLVQYAWNYAERTQRDFQTFRKAIESGQIKTAA